MPEISVIIPMYKTPKLRLRKCLDSLIKQTFKDFEVLIIDDGNTYDYECLVNEYEQADQRISLIKQPHSGVSAARNLGMKKAAGNYISFIDSDDYVDPSFLEEMYQAIQDSDVAICAVSEQYYPVYPGVADCRLFWSKPSFYNGLQYINFCHNKLYRLNLIRQNNIEFQIGVKLGEDALFLADYLKVCKSFRQVREPRYHYVPDANSAMHKYREEFWMWEQKVIERQWELFHTYPLSNFEEQAMEHWLYVKLKYALYYYIQREKDRKKRHKKLKEIYDSELFKRLKKCQIKGHKHFRKTDKYILRIWNIFGFYGIWYTYFIKYAKNLRPW